VSTEWIDDGCELAPEDGALEVEVLVILRERWKRALRENSIQREEGPGRSACDTRFASGRVPHSLAR
jgi:hypothetical protein